MINWVGIKLFYRLDLTANGLYSLSDASVTAVESLEDPLTIHVFFSQNVPAPHNNTERYLRDLLAEYSSYPPGREHYFRLEDEHRPLERRCSLG